MRILVWDLPTRLFHWLLVACFAIAYASGESERLVVVHGLSGYTALGLVAFRLIWGFTGTRYARFRSFAFGPAAALAYLGLFVMGHPPRHLGHNPAGSWVIFLLLALLASTAATGWLSLGGGETLEDVHEVLANATLAVVLFHVAGAIVSSLVHRENLVRAMIDGEKEGEASEQARGNAWHVGLIVLALVAAFWTAALHGDLPMITDPLAQQADEADDD